MKRILSLVLLLGLFTAPVFAQYDRGNSFFQLRVRSQLLLAPGTAGVPAIAWAADTDNGWYNGGSNSWALAFSGNAGYLLANSGTLGFTLHAVYPLTWGSSGITSPDVKLYRDAAATLALRDSTTAQTFHVNGTHTDASNYERLAITRAAITLETAGSGADDIDLTLAPAGNGSVLIDSAIQGSNTKTLSESSATDIVLVQVPDNSFTQFTITWTVFAQDASNEQVLSGQTVFACTNEADTEVCVAASPYADIDNTPTGTLTCTDTYAVGTDAVMFTLDCVSSLTQTTLDAYYRLDLLAARTVTPQ